MMIEQPVEVEKTLIDDVLVAVPLIFDDDRATVFIESQGVDASLVGLASDVFAGEETDAEERWHLRFDQTLELLFQGGGSALQFGWFAVGGEAEELDIAHAMGVKSVADLSAAA
ncbi:hypothetical protein LJR034_003494 [Caballeronia sp. LjRoot34]|uniref:hypothetical protein n=1 Tax=Caballeronia sp. LjRoot34 TaxID=3342325 RepID=UPI003ECCA084